MNSNTRRIVSAALAGTIIAGAHAPKAFAETPKEEVTIEENATETTYVIKEGDTLSSISQFFYGSPNYYKQIAAYNHIGNPDRIFVNQVIRLPKDIKSVTPVTPVVPPTPVTPSGEETVYVVKNGDTLSDISLAFYGNANYYRQIAAYNGISNPNKLSINQVIRLPKDIKNVTPVVPSTPSTPIAPSGEDQTYVVQKDEYLITIVKKFYGTESIFLVDKLATYNGLKDPNFIYAGQVLRIPSKKRLEQVVANDYMLQYEMLEWRLQHPGKPYPKHAPEHPKVYHK